MIGKNPSEARCKEWLRKHTSSTTSDEVLVRKYATPQSEWNHEEIRGLFPLTVSFLLMVALSAYAVMASGTLPNLMAVVSGIAFVAIWHFTHGTDSEYIENFSWNFRTLYRYEYMKHGTYYKGTIRVRKGTALFLYFSMGIGGVNDNQNWRLAYGKFMNAKDRYTLFPRRNLPSSRP